MSETETVSGGSTDVRVGRIVLAAGGLIACIALAGLGSWALLKAYLAVNQTPVPGKSAQAVAPVEPQLQVAPLQDLAALRAEEERILHSQGWVDQQAGIARIPIEQAMALLVKRARPGLEKPR